MTFQLYTEKYLIRKGISFCKLIAKERGIVPTGDKRQLFSWAEAIIQWQDSHYEPVEVELQTATITYDDSVDGSCDGEYCVIVNGDVVRRFRTYIKAETWCNGKYNLISPQQEAQDELEAELEQQIEQKISLPAQVGDEKQDYPERPRGYTTLEVDFGETIVLYQNQELDTISRDFELGLWWVGLESYDFYDDALNCIISRHQDGCYCEGGDDNGRGSGRTSPQLITDHVGFFEPYGEYNRVYSIAPNGCKIFLGTVFFQDYKGWSLDGNTYQPLEQLAKQLMV